MTQVTIVHGAEYSIAIYPDLFNPRNVILLVLHEDPNVPVEVFTLPKAMLAEAAGISNAKS